MKIARKEEILAKKERERERGGYVNKEREIEWGRKGLVWYSILILIILITIYIHMYI